MAGKTKKIDREFLITDSSVNCYGFRLLTKGYQLSEYQKNPIGYYMHNREDGVIVKWEDLRFDGDAVYGKPVINLSNERGQQCVDEIEGGFLNGASVGHIVALEWSEDPKDMVVGQTGPTITKWYNREASICDVPGNFNALALYDKDGNEIKLADFKTKKTIPDMKVINLTAADLTRLSLTDAATPAEVSEKIENLIAESAKVPKLTTDLAAANTDKQKAIDDLAAFKKDTVKGESTRYIDQLLADKKCTKETADALRIDYAENPEGVKKLTASWKPYESLVDSINDKVDDKNPELMKLMAKSGTELWTSGELDKLKSLSAAGYKIKFKEAFGEDPEEEKK